MRKQHLFSAYLLIGLGIYFLAQKFNIPILAQYYSWPTLLIIIGIALLLHSYSAKDYQHLFGGTFIFGLGIHFHGLQHDLNWPDHWAVYPFLIGITFLARSFWTKSQFIIGLFLTGVSAFLVFSERIPEWLRWMDQLTDLLDRFWPIALILLGFYLINKKR